MKDRPLTARRCGSLFGAIMCYIHNCQLTPFSANFCLCTLSSTLADKAAEHTTISAKLKGTVFIFFSSPLRSNYGSPDTFGRIVARSLC